MVRSSSLAPLPVRPLATGLLTVCVLVVVGCQNRQDVADTIDLGGGIYMTLDGKIIGASPPWPMALPSEEDDHALVRSGYCSRRHRRRDKKTDRAARSVIGRHALEVTTRES